MKNSLLLFLSFAIGAPATILAAFLLLFSLTPFVPDVVIAPFSAAIYAPKNIIIPEIDGDIYVADARELIIANYLSHYSSPLTPFSQEIISISDKYSLDFRLLVAIAQQESGLCKHIPVNSYNCWGFGIYGDKVTRFTSYSEGIETVAKGLKKNYIDKGLITPEAIMAKYTPPSLAVGGSWAKGINQFLAAME